MQFQLSLVMQAISQGTPFLPLGGSASWIPVLDLEHEQRTVLRGDKEEPIIMAEPQAGDAGGTASVLLELACQWVLVCSDAASLGAGKKDSAPCKSHAQLHDQSHNTQLGKSDYQPMLSHC